MKENLDDMYRDIILDHYRSPRGKKPLDKADIKSEGSNPSCGDEINLQVEMAEGAVKDVHVGCQGCAISVASASMLAEASKGMYLAELTNLSAAVKETLKGDCDSIPKEFEDLEALKGVKQFPVRIKCALLAWVTLIDGIESFEGEQDKPATVTTTENKQ
jgi:nitrogen fixation NifU-like protein